MTDSQNKPPQIFISYAREDFETAERLYEDLKQAGVKPWMDKKELLPGQNWKVTIDRAIRESTWFCALLSSNSVSKKGYVQRELKKGLDILDDYPESEIFLLPVRIDDCKPDHERLRDIHWADLFPDYEAGLRDILRVVSPSFDYEANHGVQNSEVASTRKKGSREAKKSVILFGGVLLALVVAVGAAFLGFRKETDSTTTTGNGKASIVTASKAEDEGPKPKSVKAKPPTKKPKTYKKARHELRSDAEIVSFKEAQQVFKLHKWRPLTYVANEYVDNGNETITDNATGLMWQKSGSGWLAYEQADAYIKKLNKEKFARYSDWRLPTVDELLSLMEKNEQSNGLYIDPNFFDKKQIGCWSADTKSSPGGAWLVRFYLSSVSWGLFDISTSWVRAVRSRQY